MATKTEKKATKSEQDIREELPLAVKGGTTHKPVWTIGDGTYKFVKPANRFGLDPEQKKIRLGNRLYARYVAGTTKKGKDLVFVGVFAPAKEGKVENKTEETVEV